MGGEGADVEARHGVPEPDVTVLGAVSNVRSVRVMWKSNELTR